MQRGERSDQVPSFPAVVSGRIGVGLGSHPVLASLQHVESIGEYRLYYSPNGCAGLTLADRATQHLLSLCDGNTPLFEIVRRDGRDAREVLAELDLLTERGVLAREDLQDGLPTSRAQIGRLTCWMHVTNDCNLACSYCYIRKSTGNMSVETGRRTVDRMSASCRQHGIPEFNLKFAGGEPLLRLELIRELIAYTDTAKAELRATFTVLTNAALISPASADFLASHDVGVGVSLDGLEAVNDAIRVDRGGIGSFARAMAGIDLLRTHGIDPLVMVTLSASNHRGLLDLTKYLTAEGLRFRFSLEKATAGHASSLARTLPSLVQSLHACFDYLEDNLPERRLDSVFKFGETSVGTRRSRPCGAGRNYFAVGHDGSLGVCGLGLGEPLGSITDQGDLVDQLAKSPLAQELAGTRSGCDECTWRVACAGGCPLHTLTVDGKVGGPSPYCSVYKAALPRMIRIRALQLIRDQAPGGGVEGDHR